MTPFIWTSAGAAQRSSAQWVSAQIKLLRRPGWLVVVPPPNGQYIPTVQYSAVQCSTVQHSTATGHCAALSAMGERTTKLGCYYSKLLFKIIQNFYFNYTI